ncbi:MAG: type II secretion system protein [Betaproteobacteria bacterium]
MVALIGLVLASAAQVWSTGVRRDGEAQLLFVGDEFRKAISSYYLRTPGANKQYPKSMQELLLDSRFPDTVRHLRRMYVDPFSGKAEWGVVRQTDGGITGVHSLSQGVPLKRAGFERKDESFAGADRYAKWVFSMDANELAAAGGAGSGGAAGRNAGSDGVVNAAGPAPAAAASAAPVEVPANEARDCANALQLDIQACSRVTSANGGNDAACIDSARLRSSACVTGRALPLLGIN